MFITLIERGQKDDDLVESLGQIGRGRGDVGVVVMVKVKVERWAGKDVGGVAGRGKRQLARG